jgi:DNA-binding NarL/FixJ family response regulator
MTQLIPDKLEEKKIIVFHADDHELLRYGVKKSLERWPEIDIIKGISNGKELLKLLETEIPDVILLDFQMPVMDGRETLTRIKEKYPYLKVIILTMHNDEDTIKKMMRLGANSFVTLYEMSDKIAEAILCVHQFNYFYSEAIERAFLGPRPLFERIGREFTVKEQQLLDLLAENKTESQIADTMDISKRTVAALIEKLNRRRHGRDDN